MRSSQLPRKIKLIDRTRTVLDWKCPRARFYANEWKGRGIVKSSESIELTTGIIVHDCLAAIATFTSGGVEVPIDDIVTTAYKDMYARLIGSEENPSSDLVEFAREQATLIEGMLRGFYKHLWPKLMAKYPKIINIESDMEFDLGTSSCDTCGGPGSGGDGPCIDCEGTGELPFVFMTKPDLIVEDHEGNLVYLEYKTTSSKKDKWINSWDTQVQLHSSIKATKQTLGIEPAYVQIVGLYKGYESYGKQSSPFCYAYKRKGNPPFTKDETIYEYKAGFKRYPTWELDGGIKAWIEAMPDSVLANQFPMTPEIYINDDMINSFFTQRLSREVEIATSAAKLNSGTLTNEEITSELDKHFQQKFDQCEPSFGWACQFKKLCFGQVTDPLTEGYVSREPHHERERILLGLD